MALARARMNARKEDTRRKIELGGLVIKAGLDQEDRAVILGALMLAAKALQLSPQSEAARTRFKEAGERAFIGEEHEPTKSP